jgi:AmpE protein
MIFLSLVVVLVLVQLWGSGAPLQRDGWFFLWLDRLAGVPVLGSVPTARLAIGLGLPALVLFVVVWLIANLLSANWLFVVYVPVLLYSLGRGDFTTDVKAYLVACRREDSVAAANLIDEMRGTADGDTTEVVSEDWDQLNEEALRVISYRGFERMFAVLFWFFLLGAVGALLYRLSVLYREREENADNWLARKWLWLIEWPAVRVMGLTWALVGNFDSCFRRWQRSLVDVASSSMTVLSSHLHGALGVAEPRSAEAGEGGDEGEALAGLVAENLQPADSFSLLKNSQPLFSRSLLLWVFALALITLLV